MNRDFHSNVIVVLDGTTDRHNGSCLCARNTYKSIRNFLRTISNRLCSLLVKKEVEKINICASFVVCPKLADNIVQLLWKYKVSSLRFCLRFLVVSSRGGGKGRKRIGVASRPNISEGFWKGTPYGNANDGNNNAEFVGGMPRIRANCFIHITLRLTSTTSAPDTLDSSYYLWLADKKPPITPYVFSLV